MNLSIYIYIYIYIYQLIIIIVIRPERSCVFENVCIDLLDHRTTEMHGHQLEGVNSWQYYTRTNEPLMFSNEGISQIFPENLVALSTFLPGDNKDIGSMVGFAPRVVHGSIPDKGKLFSYQLS